MLMHIGKSTSFAAAAATAPRPLEHRHPIKDLRHALRSGDLDAASNAYAKLVSNAPKVVARIPDGPFAQIGTALAAGDIAGAQSAFATMVKSHLPKRDGQTPTSPPTWPSDDNPISVAGGPLNVIA